MVDQNQNNNNDFPEGFLIKDKSGQFKKVKDDTVTDYQPGVKKAPAGPPSVSPAKLSPTPAKPPVPPQPVEPVTKPTPPPPSLSPQPPISSSDKAALYMEPDDEEEIKKHAEDLKKLAAKPSFDLGVTVNSLIEKIIHQHDLHFENEVMLKRFSKVLESRFKEIRNSIETQEVLTRPKKVGGLELSPESAKKVVSAVEAEIASLRQAGLEKKEPAIKKIEEKVPPPSPPSEKKKQETFAPPPPPFVPKPTAKPYKEIEAKPQQISPTEEKPEDLAKEIKKELEAVKAKEQQIKVPVEPEKIETHELYKQPAEEMPRIAQTRQPEPARPQMVDIKQPVKVVGPVEELADIDLKEFRRLGSNPRESVEKILEKVELLEEDSWQFKMDGIAAWKKSKTNQLYLEIGQESIESGISVEEVIRKRQNENRPYLLTEEFLAINNLNSQLTI